MSHVKYGSGDVTESWEEGGSQSQARRNPVRWRLAACLPFFAFPALMADGSGPSFFPCLVSLFSDFLSYFRNNFIPLYAAIMAAGLLWKAVQPKATEDLTQLSVRRAGLTHH